MIEWSNTNQGFTFVVLTIALAVLTVVNLIVSMRMARLMQVANALSADSIRQVSLLEKSRLRPEVRFNLVARSHIVRAIVRNDGHSAAVNVRISVVPAIVRGTETESGLTRGRIARLAPGEEF